MELTITPVILRSVARPKAGPRDEESAVVPARNQKQFLRFAQNDTPDGSGKVTPAILGSLPPQVGGGEESVCHRRGRQQQTVRLRPTLEDAAPNDTKPIHHPQSHPVRP